MPSPSGPIAPPLPPDPRIDAFALAHTWLGDKVGGLQGSLSADYQVFANATVYDNNGQVHEVHGLILVEYNSVGGPLGVLGWPTTDETAIPGGGGRYNYFQSGGIFWSVATGAHEVHGPILTRYAALGLMFGVLGYPTSDQHPTPDGIGHYNHFQSGSIYSGPAGVYEVHGAIYDKWASLGWEKSVLGYPASDQGNTPDGVGHYNHFQFGSVYSGPPGVYEVHGPIYDKWASLGWEKGVLGYPASDQGNTPDGLGHYSHFQYGSIYSGPPGVYEIHNAIYDKWASLGWERSYLGYPTSDEHDCYSSARCSSFQHGTVYWTAATGAIDLPESLAVTGNVWFRDSTPLGGHGSLTLHDTGAISYQGQVHDSGALDYGFRVIFGIKAAADPQGLTLDFAAIYNGSVQGSASIFLVGGTNTQYWNKSSSSGMVRAYWPEIIQGARAGGQFMEIDMDGSSADTEVRSLTGNVTSVIQVYSN
jgi:uncharacterized protein with LGFP repeats